MGGAGVAQVLWLSLVTASVAFTFCETKLFAGHREWVKAQSAWVGKLACCGYCLGHWVSLGLVAIYRPTVFELEVPDTRVATRATICPSCLEKDAVGPSRTKLLGLLVSFERFGNSGAA